MDETTLSQELCTVCVQNLSIACTKRTVRQKDSLYSYLCKTLGA